MRRLFIILLPILRVANSLKSKAIDADWIFTPTLPEKRQVVMMTAVEMGYYNPKRKCTQKDLAKFLGIQQGTVAEHLRHAESEIINSWAKHSGQ